MNRTLQTRLRVLEQADNPEPITFVVIIDPYDDQPGIDIDVPAVPDGATVIRLMYVDPPTSNPMNGK